MWRHVSLVLFATLLVLHFPIMAMDADDQHLVSESRLLSARANWESLDHPNYRFTLRRQCYCAGPERVIVEVANGTITAVRDARNNEPLPAHRLGDYRTIPELFAEIDAAVPQKPDSLSIEYDRSLGYPRRVRIDFSYRMADEEIDYEIESMDILPGAG